MKKVKIKLTVLTLFFASLLMVSCDSETTENKEEDKVLTYDIEYETLEFKNGKFYKDKDLKDLFSGTAGTKNSDDKITKYATIKNGYLVNKKHWKDFGGELFLIRDMEYKNGDPENGWYVDINNQQGITLTEQLNVYKNGKYDYKESWEIVRIDEWDYDSDTEIKGYYFFSGDDLEEKQGIFSKSEMKDYFFHFVEITNSCKVEGVDFYGFEVNNEKFIEFFECLKSQNIKNYYHIEE